MNIRFAGEQVQIGAVVLKKDTTINLGAIGYLYMLGIHKVEVSRKPKAIIIVTGNELMAPGQELTSGKIYESNSYTLKAALKSVGVDSEIQSVKDDFESTKHMISKALSQCDLVITSGGISVGDYDFVGKAMNELGVNEIFYKLKQKPGKPLFFGTKGETSVFALPGNPAAVLSCFYMYVIPAIRIMQGYSTPRLEQRTLKITSEYKKGAMLTHFLKAYANGNEVRILNAQSSAMLSSFSEANCLAKLPEGRTDWSVGDDVEVFMLP
jgi:molybdopterin molybdotransferase